MKYLFCIDTAYYPSVHEFESEAEARAEFEKQLNDEFLNTFYRTNFYIAQVIEEKRIGMEDR